MALVMAGGTQWERRALLGRLDREQFNLVVEATDVAEAAEVAREHEPAVCVLAGRVRGGTLSAITRITAASPEAKVVVVVDDPVQDGDLWAIRAGAAGYLNREIGADRLAAALSAVARGESLIPRELTTRIVSELRSATPGQPAPRRSTGIGYTLRYPWRFTRHLWRRRRSGMPLRIAWRSARERMHHYR